jgi:hypothetical protein
MKALSVKSSARQAILNELGSGSFARARTVAEIAGINANQVPSEFDYVVKRYVIGG